MEYAYLTTIDNPYDPYDEFDQWFAFDTEKGYNSCGLLERIANTSDDLSPEDNRIEINEAIDQIVLRDPTGIYKSCKNFLILFIKTLCLE